jgi:subtilisin family serine protease
MKYPFLTLRCKLAFYFFALLFVFVVTWGQAQMQNNVEAGVIRIKVSPTLATQLEHARFSRNANNELVTGITSLDNISQLFRSRSLTRVFRPAGKFEAKHKKHNLHLWYEVKIDQKASVQEALSAYRNIPQVIVSEPVYKKAIVGSENKNFGPVVYEQQPVAATLPSGSNDPMLANQWHYNNTGQTSGKVGADISLFKAWAIETGNSNVIVAITDGGIQVNHPDIAANMWINVNEIPGNNLDDDNNGYVDDINGYGFGDGTGNIAADAHGTHVGGTIAAVSNNGLGVAGVAGGSGNGDGVRLMSCAAFGDVGTGGFENTYTYAADNGALISQNSWGYTSPGVFEQAVLDAIDYFRDEAGTDENGNQVGLMKGGIVIFAAGNDNANEKYYPGFYENTLSVSATSHQDKKGWYSNFGPWVDIAAPGGETNLVSQQGVLSTINNNQYGFFQGTSMACPHVSGVAALVVSKFGGPGFTPDLLLDRLVKTVDNIDSAHPQFAGLLGAGRLNAFAALQENDNAPPNAITDLTAIKIGTRKLTLKWTSPLDSGNNSATKYDIRYSLAPITALNFDSATVIDNAPAPGSPGTKDSVQVSQLLPETIYFFAIKSIDFFGNVSAISNVLEQATNSLGGIVVTPESLYSALFTDQIATEQLTIQNNGADTLRFSVDVVRKNEMTRSGASTKQISIPARAAQTSSVEKQVVTGAVMSATQLSIKSVRKAATTKKVLILSPDNDVQDIQIILNSFDDIEADIYAKSSLPGITLADLAPYDIVFTNNNTQWLQSGSVDPVVIGNLLADYVDQGGKVIVNQFVYSFDAWQLSGRFITENYGPFLPSTTDAQLTVTLGSTVSGHPLMDGVDTLSYTGFVQNVSLALGATSVATWSNGELFVAANNDVVALNVLPSLGNAGPLQWSGDLATLYHNAIHWLGEKSSFITVNPTEGFVLPGDELNLEVTINTTGLAEKTYQAAVVINDAAGDELISVPLTVQVLGEEFAVIPDSLSEALEKDKTSVKTIVLRNNGKRDVNFNVRVQDLGLAPVVMLKKSTTPALASASKPRVNFSALKQASAGRENISRTGIAAIVPEGLSAGQQGIEPYIEGFELFEIGDINGQLGWIGRWGNWTVEAENPAGGQKHFRGLADGLGVSLAISPRVAVGTEAFSTATVKVNITGEDTWQIIPQSPSEAFVNTRIQFTPDRKVQALVSDGAGGGSFAEVNATVPNGYFDLTIEVEKATKNFSIYFNDEKVFTGLGFASNIEQIVVYGLMDTAGPTIDLDDLEVIDGKRAFGPPYMTVSPLSGVLAGGQDLEITVKFNTEDVDFGTHLSAIKIKVDDKKEFTVPTELRVFGDPNIEVDPTVIQATVEYKGDTTHTFAIKNTGGNPLEYSLQVIGADPRTMRELPVGPASKFPSWKTDKRIGEKLAKDNSLSKTLAQEPTTLNVLAGIPLLNENFDGTTFPPQGWTVTDDAGTGIVWKTAADYSEGNYSGSGEAATVSSDFSGTVDFDASLISPTIDATGYKNIAVQFNANYQNYANFDFLDVDIQVEGSSSWTNVLRWNEDHGSFRAGPGQFVTLALDQFIGAAAKFKLRWRYYDPSTNDYDWYAQIDDVVILGESRTWVSVSPSSGTVPVRGVKTINAHFKASDLEEGFYVAGILVRSNVVQRPVIGVVASLEVLGPPAISVEPTELHEELYVGQTAQQTLTITNSGESSLAFSFDAIVAAGPPSVKKQPLEPTSPRTANTPSTLPLNGRAAVLKPVAKLAATELYATSFEEFASGDINGQEEWFAQYGNWTVESINPFSGVQHFRGLSDGFGQSFSVSPSTLPGSDSISSTSMKLKVGTGVTWQVIPQSPTETYVVTRLEIGVDGTLRALVNNGSGAIGTFESIPVALPSDYFDLKIQVARATSMFTIYINDKAVFKGQGFATYIEQVAFLSLMETAGPVLDVDNLSILDGPVQKSWLLVNPVSGVVPGGSSASITVTFDAREQEEGVYTDSLTVYSNDPSTPLVLVPVTFDVDYNASPVLAEVGQIKLHERELRTITFTATDEDDSVVSVVLHDLPRFVTLQNSGNGFATYKFNPAIGDDGEYDLTVVATDSHGFTDVDSLHVSVVQLAVNSFSLVNTATGEVISEFTDGVTINRLDPAFPNYVIRATTSPDTVGSVKFVLNNKQINIANTVPYQFRKATLLELAAGTYTLIGEPFTLPKGHGLRGRKKQVTITILDARIIQEFSLVNTATGEVIRNFTDSLSVNTSDQNFANYTIQASTNPSKVGSVKFTLNGSQQNIANDVPYRLKKGALQLLSEGNHVLIGEPFSERAGHGQRGVKKSVVITILTEEAMAARGVKSLTENGMDGEESKSLTIYPVPVTDQLNVTLTDKSKGNVQLTIINVHGQVFHKVNVGAGALQQYPVSLNNPNMCKGMYYIILQKENGEREVQKFIKE